MHFLWQMKAMNTDGFFNVDMRIQAVVCAVSQKKQKSEFRYATNPTGCHRLDEPPEFFLAL